MGDFVLQSILFSCVSTVVFTYYSLMVVSSEVWKSVELFTYRSSLETSMLNRMSTFTENGYNVYICTLSVMFLVMSFLQLTVGQFYSMYEDDITQAIVLVSLPFIVSPLRVSNLVLSDRYRNLCVFPFLLVYGFRHNSSLEIYLVQGSMVVRLVLESLVNMTSKRPSYVYIPSASGLESEVMYVREILP